VGMTRHLQACKARKAAFAEEDIAGKPKTTVFHLTVKGTYAPAFWLHLEAPAGVTLWDLDQFLRNLWLECCGHLSMFEIADQRFMVQVFDDWWAREDRDMNVELGEVLEPGLEFSHEYDFGSSTYLSLKVVEVREGAAPEDEPIRILARNELPELQCETCGKPATLINVFENYALLCDECDETEGYGEGLLPVVNSPRIGVCGYTGGAW
jgi:hypothetical protein